MQEPTNLERLFNPTFPHALLLLGAMASFEILESDGTGRSIGGFERLPTAMICLATSATLQLADFVAFPLAPPTSRLLGSDSWCLAGAWGFF